MYLISTLSIVQNTSLFDSLFPLLCRIQSYFSLPNHLSYPSSLLSSLSPPSYIKDPTLYSAIKQKQIHLVHFHTLLLHHFLPPLSMLHRILDVLNDAINKTHTFLSTLNKHNYFDSLLLQLCNTFICDLISVHRTVERIIKEEEEKEKQEEEAKKDDKPNQALIAFQSEPNPSKTTISNHYYVNKLSYLPLHHSNTLQTHIDYEHNNITTLNNAAIIIGKQLTSVSFFSFIFCLNYLFSYDYVFD